jgi:hypothetical protein
MGSGRILRQTQAARGRALWHRRVRAALTERLELKATALLLAVVLWFMVSARETAEEIVGVRFAPQLDSSLVLREPPRPVSALVIGRRGELLELLSTAPTIRRPIDDEVPDTLTLELRPGDVELPPNVEARVSDVQPRRLTLYFQSDLTRSVPVRASPDVPADGSGRLVRFEPESVRVSGPRRAVARVAAVYAAKDAIPPADSGTFLVTLDTTDLGVLVRPARVMAIVHVPLLSGTPANGLPRADTTRAGARPRRP